MTYYYDLHIHSCLSACADVLLSPNNIFNMANLKGLNIISITDHNTLKQYPVLKEISESYDLLLIPGVEVTTIEEIDLLIYFNHFNQAMMFDHILEAYHTKTPYAIEHYGTQIITDNEDIEHLTIDYLLSRPLNLSYIELLELLKPFEHIIIAAHLNKSKHSAIRHLKSMHVDAVELMLYEHHETFKVEHDLMKYHVVYSSDAHQLTDISERNNYNNLELEDLSIEAFFKYFKHG